MQESRIKPEAVPAWHEPFLAMLPQIQRRASLAFRGLPEETRQELIQDVVCHCLDAYKRLHDQGKADVATAGTLANNRTVTRVLGASQTPSQRPVREAVLRGPF